MDLKRRIPALALGSSVLAATAFAGIGATAAADGSEATYRVTVTNLAPGQPQTPPLVVLHDASTSIVEAGAPASDGLQQLAENGNPQVLLDALTGYDGTVVFVSHDRSFIESLATRIIELKPSEDDDREPSTVTDFPGDYTYYEWKVEHVASRALETTRTGAGRRAGQATASDQEAHKTRRNRIQKLERLMEELLEQMDTLQSRHQEIQHELTDPHVYGVGASVRRLTGELATLDAEIAELSERWETTETEHSQLLSG